MWHSLNVWEQRHVPPKRPLASWRYISYLFTCIRVPQVECHSSKLTAAAVTWITCRRNSRTQHSKEGGQLDYLKLNSVA
jgi:hypothetical protein